MGLALNPTELKDLSRMGLQPSFSRFMRVDAPYSAGTDLPAPFGDGIGTSAERTLTYYDWVHAVAYSCCHDRIA